MIAENKLVQQLYWKCWINRRWYGSSVVAYHQQTKGPTTGRPLRLLSKKAAINNEKKDLRSEDAQCSFFEVC